MWFSEEWTDTLVDLKFLDTVSGDAVVALRDNKGRSLKTGPLEQFVSVHPRKIQQDPRLYDLIYGTSQNRIDRLTLAKMSSEIRGIDPQTEQVLAITDIFVLPTGEGDRRQPWIFLSFIVAPQDEEAPSSADTAAESQSLLEEAQQATSAASGPIHDSYRRDVCISPNLDIFVTFMGRLEEPPHRQVLMYVCDHKSRMRSPSSVRVLSDCHIQAFQALSGLLVHYSFIFSRKHNKSRKNALSNRASPEKHAREGLTRIGPRVRLLCHFCQNDCSRIRIR